VFIDTSRNGRRHFCCLRCANQVNVANHRHRRRQAVAASAVDDGAPGKVLLGHPVNPSE